MVAGVARLIRFVLSLHAWVSGGFAFIKQQVSSAKEEIDIVKQSVDNVNNGVTDLNNNVKGSVDKLGSSEAEMRQAVDKKVKIHRQHVG